MSTFWQSTQGGRRHWADRRSPEYVDGLLVVMVHGVLAGCKVWKNVAPRALADAGVDADVIAFNYASIPFASGSIGTAAGRLIAAIRRQFADLARRPSPTYLVGTKHHEGVRRGYSHILFVVHSNGGRVVKRMLVEDGRTLLGHHLSGKPLGQSQSLAGIARRVVNVAVPHRGAGIPMSGILTAVCIAQAVLWPFLVLLRTIGASSKMLSALGFNGTFFELIRWHPSGAQDERGWMKAAADCEAADLPFPRAIDLIPATDRAIAVEPARSLLARPSTVSSMAQAGHRERAWVVGPHPLLSIDPKAMRLHLKREILRFKCRHSAVLATRTIELNHYYDLKRAFPVFELYGLGTDAARSGQQRAVLAYLEERLKAGNIDARFFLLRGGPGAGKSRLLARLARRAAIRRLTAGEHPDEENSRLVPPVFFFDLKSLRVEWPPEDGNTAAATDGEGLRLWASILDAWCRSATQISRGAPIYSSEDVRRLLRLGRSVLILDGVDDLLTRLREGQRLLAGLLAALRSEHSEAQGFGSVSVIVGVRDGQEGVESVLTSGWREVCVDKVSEDAARHRVPSVDGVLKNIESARAQGRMTTQQAEQSAALLLTPLMLAALAADHVALKRLAATDAVIYTAELLRAAAEAVIQKTLDRDGVMDASNAHEGPPFTVQQGMDAIGIVARLYYEYEGEGPATSEARIREGLGTIVRSLGLAAGATDGGGQPRTTVGDQRWTDAVHLVRDPASLRFLFLMFFEARQSGEWSFNHTLWRDFFVAWHYNRCARDERVEELGPLAYLPDITALAGHLLGPWSPAEALMRAASARTRETGDPLYLSNLFALCAWNARTEWSPDLVRTTLNAMSDDTIPEFPRCLIVSGLVLRVMGGPLGAYRAPLGQAMAALLAADPHPSTPSPLRSLVWMYLRAFDPTRHDEWPGLGAVSAEAFTRSFGTMTRARKAKTLQLSLRVLASWPLNVNPEREIATLHYIYLLLLFDSVDLLNERDALAQVLAPGSVQRLCFERPAGGGGPFDHEELRAAVRTAFATCIQHFNGR